jgi:hypothetical protein
MTAVRKCECCIDQYVGGVMFFCLNPRRGRQAGHCIGRVAHSYDYTLSRASEGLHKYLIV